MLRTISQYLYRKNSIPVALLLTVCMILYASLVMGGQSECLTSELSSGQSILGLKFGYDMAFVRAIFIQLSDQAFVCYLSLLKIWDNLFPLIYGSMYIAWLSVIYRKAVPTISWPINLYPLIPVAMDWIENYFEYRLVAYFYENEGIEKAMVETASLITQIKWSASMLNYLIIIIGVVMLLIQRTGWLKSHK